LLPQHQLLTTPAACQLTLLQQPQLNLLQSLNNHQHHQHNHQQLSQQQQQQHQLGQTTQQLTNQQQSLTCKSSFKSFFSTPALKEHRKREHGDSSCGVGVGVNGNASMGLVDTNGSGVSVLAPPSVHYQCTVCGKSMKNAARLYAHFSAAHTGDFNSSSGGGVGGRRSSHTNDSGGE